MATASGASWRRTKTFSPPSTCRALSAARVGLFAEVTEQRPAPAAGGFGITDHCIEPRLASGALGSGPRVNETAEDDGVRAVVEQQAIGRQAVAPGAADFLVIALE